MGMFISQSENGNQLGQLRKPWIVVVYFNSILSQILHFHTISHFELWPTWRGKMNENFMFYNLLVNVLPIFWNWIKFCIFVPLLFAWVFPPSSSWQFFMKDKRVQSKWKYIFSKWNIWNIYEWNINGRKYNKTRIWKKS
jgi:hypothetical protein